MKKVAQSTALLFLASVFASAQQKPEFVYTGGSAVNGFAVNPTTGGLTAVPGSPFAAPAVNALAISPAGNFLFAGNTGGIVAATINPSTGTLTSVPGSPFSSNLDIAALGVAPNGRYLYAGASPSAGNFFIYTFAIDGNVGAITPLGSPVSLNGLQATSFAVSPGDGVLYAGTTSNLLGFTVDSKNGTLSPIAMDVTGDVAGNQCQRIPLYDLRSTGRIRNGNRSVFDQHQFRAIDSGRRIAVYRREYGVVCARAGPRGEIPLPDCWRALVCGCRVYSQFDYGRHLRAGGWVSVCNGGRLSGGASCRSIKPLCLYDGRRRERHQWIQFERNDREPFDN